MAVDFKKLYHGLFQPGRSPERVLVPPLTYIAVDGRGDPNEPGGAYAGALALLYALCYTIKMSKLGADVPKGYYDYVVPPLEGLWEMSGGRAGVDYGDKAGFVWTAMICQPEFVTEEVFRWAAASVAEKKGLDPAPARLYRYDEGDCVQCMHLGAYDDEPATMARMDAFLAENGLSPDYGARRHHEIYLSDPRKTAVEKRRTILRAPVKEN